MRGRLVGQFGPEVGPQHSETNKREPFSSGWKIENPWAPEGETSCPSHNLGITCRPRQTKPPFPTQFPITIACRRRAIASGRETTLGKVEAGKPRCSAGPMQGQGWTQGSRTALLLGNERPVLILGSTSTERGCDDSQIAWGSFSCCHVMPFLLYNLLCSCS